MWKDQFEQSITYSHTYIDIFLIGGFGVKEVKMAPKNFSSFEKKITDTGGHGNIQSYGRTKMTNSQHSISSF